MLSLDTGKTTRLDSLVRASLKPCKDKGFMVRGLCGERLARPSSDWSIPSRGHSAGIALFCLATSLSGCGIHKLEFI